jgi:hypothetical protein
LRAPRYSSLPLRVTAIVLLIGTDLVLGWALLMATIALGLAYGEMNLNPYTDVGSALALDHASDIGAVMFLLLQCGFAWMMVAFGILRYPRFHWILRIAAIAIVAGVACYGLVLAALVRGGAPDPIESLAYMFSNWLQIIGDHLR